MNKAYSYIRFSTPDQAKGDSLRRQKELSEQYAKEHNLVLDTSVNLTDLGVSAFDRSNITKGALGEFLKLIKSGRIEPGSHLLVENLDRLSRAQVGDALSVFLEIIRAGVTIVTLQDNRKYDTSSINDLTNLIYSLLIMSRSSEESETKSRRGKASWEQKKKNLNNKRLSARCPYWMKATKGDIGFELIEERANVVRSIFRMAKNGIGNSTITKRLNASNTPTFSNRTDGWQESYIQKILRNKAVYGILEIKVVNDNGKKENKLIENYYPKILTKEEWTLINHLRESRRTRGGFRKGKNLSNLFSGLLKCGYCNGSMVMGGHTKKNAKSESVTRKYVVCSRAKRGLGCKSFSWSYNELEKEILKFCTSSDFSQALGSSTELNLEIESSIKEEISLEIQEDNLEKKLQSLASNLEKISETPETIIKSIFNFENKLKTCKENLLKAQNKTLELKASLNSQTSNVILIKEILLKLDTLKDQELHNFRIQLSSLIHQNVKSINIYPNGILLTEGEDAAFIRKDMSDLLVDKLVEKLGKYTGKRHRKIHINFKNGHRTIVSEQTVFNSDIKNGFKTYIRSELDEILKT